MCNCSKRKVTPPPPPPAQAAAPAAPVEKTAVAVTASGTGARQSFSLTTPDRRVQTFGSRLEAEAARVRAGGTGMIVPGR